jgi:hypothetical protein
MDFWTYVAIYGMAAFTMAASVPLAIWVSERVK